MKVTIKALKAKGFLFEKDGEGDYIAYHKETGIQICRDKDGTFWTDYCGELVDLKKMRQVDTILKTFKIIKL